MQNFIEPTPDEKLIAEGLREVAETLNKNNSGTETPAGVYTFVEIAESVEKYLPNMTTALKLVLAVATSGKRKNRVMLWLLLVGAPSSGKTDLVRLMKDNSSVLSLDNLTLNSFISGERPTEKEKVHDLLPLLNNKCLIVKDWTVIFSLDERMTKKIIGDMVGAYDKSLSKFSSRRGNITYDAEFSHLGCITPATLNRHQNYLNMIGPRFLSYGIGEITSDQEEKSFKAIFSNQDRSEIEKSVAKKVNAYLSQLNNEDISAVGELSEDAKKYLQVASRIMARARGIVIIKSSKFINDLKEEISYYEPLDIQIEQPWRSVQQLILLSKYLAFVTGKLQVDHEELSIIREVVLSSMPADRAQAIKALASRSDGSITAKELSDQVDKSSKTSRRLLEELVFLKLIKKIPGSGQMAATYTVIDEFRSFVTVSTREFLSSYSQQGNDDKTSVSGIGSESEAV